MLWLNWQNMVSPIVKRSIHLFKCTSEDFRTQFSDLEMVLSFTEGFGDSNLDVQRAAVSVISKLVDYGQSHCGREKSSRLNLQQRTFVPNLRRPKWSNPSQACLMTFIGVYGKY
jgi:hypothetical protein